MKKGFLNFVLHAHLPYVRHPEHESFFEENWLFEAMTECYIPLINVFDKLEKDNIDYRLTVSLSPTLISMLTDDLLQSRYQLHLDKQIELAEKEIIRTHKQAELQRLARLYRRFFLNCKQTYLLYQGNLLNAFKKHYLSGRLELITTAATHGFLPLLNINHSAVKNQIEVGINTFKSNLGFSPSGFWLPECAYYPGLEEHLADVGVGYFLTDSHAITDASEAVKHGTYAPLNCGNNVMAFARDQQSSELVWSAEEGYPSDENYREYYSDIGFDLELDYIAPYILDNSERINTGIKYHCISGKHEHKDYYKPKLAKKTTLQHAQDFINKKRLQIHQLSEHMDTPPIIIAPFDAELFGHWWFEGPCWLETVLRLVDKETNCIQTVSCNDYLKQYQNQQTATPASSSWGHEGYSSYWINEKNDWIYPFLHKAAEEMQQLAIDFQGLTASSLQRRALNQAARCLLLAQASDWPFIMKSGTSSEYANKRITDHLARFNFLHESIRKNRINEHYLLALETMDNIFPEIDYQNFAS